MPTVKTTSKYADSNKLAESRAHSPEWLLQLYGRKLIKDEVSLEIVHVSY